MEKENRNQSVLAETTQHTKSIWTNAIEITIITLVILVPIAFYLETMSIFLSTKEMIFELLIIIGLLFWAFKTIDQQQVELRANPLNLLVLSFILICILSLLWTDNIYTSIRELPLFLAGPLLYFITINNISEEGQVARIINSLLIIGALFGIYGIFQYIVDFPIWSTATGRRKVMGLFGNVNYFAEYLIIPLSIAVSLFLTSRKGIKKILFFIAILTMGTTLVLTFTRGSYLGLAASLLFIAVLFIVYGNSVKQSLLINKKKILIAFLAVITVIIFVFLTPNPLNRPGTAVYKIKDRVSITRLTKDPSLKRRIATWKFTILMIKDRPWLGSGIGTYKYNTLRYQAQFFSEGENRTLYPHGFADKAHNEYLQLWAELGLVGLVIFFWLIYTYFRFGLRTLRDITDNKDIEDKVKFTRQGLIIGLMGAVVAFLVDAFFGFPMHLPASVMLFWLVLSLTVVSGYGLSRDYALSETSGLKKGRYLSRKIAKIKETTTGLSKNKAIDNKQIVKTKVLKYVFYIWVLILAIMFSFNIVKPFMAQIYWFYADREKNRGDSGINETIQNYRLALKWDPFLGEVYYDIGSILLKEGLPTPALDYFLKAEKYTDLPGLPLAIARVYTDKDMPAEAATKLKQAITYEGSKRAMLPLYNELGNMYLTLTKPKLAEIAFKDALKINGGSDDDILSSHFGLARAYLNQGLHDQAIKEFNKVTELAPNSLEAKYAQKAIEQLTQADISNPDSDSDSVNNNDQENNL